MAARSLALPAGLQQIDPQGMKYRQSWGPVGIYTYGDTVTVAGETYVCIVKSSVLDYPPTSPTVWEVVGQGAQGPPGAAATIAVGTVSTGAPGSSATVTNSGTSSAAVFDFSIPEGATGAAGAPGAPGTPGAAATIAVGTVSTGAPGSSATVTNSGSSSAAVFDFSIPEGAAGTPGAPGAAATIAVGTVTTGAPGSSATVTNSGSSSAAVFDFAIPQGPVGPAYTPTITKIHSIVDGGGALTGSVTGPNQVSQVGSNVTVTAGHTYRFTFTVGLVSNNTSTTESMYFGLQFDAGYTAVINLYETIEDTNAQIISGSLVVQAPPGSSYFAMAVGIGNDSNTINASLYTAYLEDLTP